MVCGEGGARHFQHIAACKSLAGQGPPYGEAVACHPGAAEGRTRDPAR